MFCKNPKVFLIFFLGLIGLFITPPLCYAEKSSSHNIYQVEEVLSGDTLQLTTGSVIRYSSILAPSMDDDRPHVQEFAQESKEFHGDLVKGKKIRVEFGAQLKSSDGTYQVFAFLEDGTHINKKLLESGYVKLNIEPPNLQYAEDLRDASRYAREKTLGLWLYESHHEKKYYYLGNKSTNKYHFEGCRLIDHLPSSHMKKFDSKVKASSEGYRFCSICRNRYQDETSLF